MRPLQWAFCGCSPKHSRCRRTPGPLCDTVSPSWLGARVAVGTGAARPTSGGTCSASPSTRTTPTCCRSPTWRHSGSSLPCMSASPAPPRRSRVCVDDGSGLEAAARSQDSRVSHRATETPNVSSDPSQFAERAMISWSGRADVAGFAGHTLLTERFPARWRDLFEGPMGIAPRMRVREFVMGLAIMCSSSGPLGEEVMATRIKTVSDLVRGVGSRQPCARRPAGHSRFLPACPSRCVLLRPPPPPGRPLVHAQGPLDRPGSAHRPGRWPHGRRLGRFAPAAGPAHQRYVPPISRAAPALRAMLTVRGGMARAASQTRAGGICRGTTRRRRCRTMRTW